MTPEPSTPLFSVVLPTYDRSAMLARAARSVLQQDFPGFELIVVDDASPEPAATALAPLADPRIKLLRNETNLGVAGARNRGVEAARGAYVSFLDDDDEYSSSFLRATDECLRAAPARVAMCWSSVEIAEHAAFPGCGPVLTQRAFPTRFPSETALIEAFLSVGAGFGVTVRRAALNEVGLFDPSLRTAEDTDLFYRLLTRGYRPVVLQGTHVRLHGHGAPRLSGPAMLAERITACHRLLREYAPFMDSHPSLRHNLTAGVRHLESLRASTQAISGRSSGP